jgi:hypothetical protein
MVDPTVRPDDKLVLDQVRVQKPKPARVYDGLGTSKQPVMGIV